MCLCFSDDPVDEDPRGRRSNQFHVSMKDAPCTDPLMFCGSVCCFPCANCYMRYKALDDSYENYTCCQGYYDCACFKAGSFGDRGNPCCLILEGWCCGSCAVSSTRMFIMDKYDLQSDPCDNRIIRFNNFMQLLSCVCSILAMFDPSFQEAAEIIRFIADIVYMITSGCMNAQGHVEIKHQKSGGGGSSVYPPPTGGGMQPYTVAPKVDQMERPNQQPQYAQAQPYAQAQVVQASNQQTFLVEIPPNVYPGTQLQVAAPNGQQVMFEVPQGAHAGQQVMVPY